PRSIRRSRRAARPRCLLRQLDGPRIEAGCLRRLPLRPDVHLAGGIIPDDDDGEPGLDTGLLTERCGLLRNLRADRLAQFGAADDLGHVSFSTTECTERTDVFGYQP